MTRDGQRMPSAAVIGEGKMAHDCLLEAVDGGRVRVALVVTRLTSDMASRRLAALCEKHAIEVVDTPDPNSAESLARLRAAAPDLLLNINGFSIFGDELLAIAPRGVVNFHNGPLPRYAGMNIPTWAIWNGEQTHGVTWHFMDRGIDTGDIVVQGTFDLGPRETAMSLTVKCILEGIRLFDRALAGAMSDPPERKRQTGPRSHYRKSDIPHDGIIDLNWAPERIDRLLRALAFHPMPTTLFPRVHVGRGVLRIGRAEWVADPHGGPARSPGTIVALSEGSLVLQAGRGRLVIRSCVGPDGEALSLREAVADCEAGASEPGASHPSGATESDAI